MVVTEFDPANANQQQQPTSVLHSASRYTNGVVTPTGTGRKTVKIVAVEDDDDDYDDGNAGIVHGEAPAAASGGDDVIPGPPEWYKNSRRNEKERSTSTSRTTKLIHRVLNISSTKAQQPQQPSALQQLYNTKQQQNGEGAIIDELQLSTTEHNWAGAGILASRADLELPPAEFAAGCNLLQAAAMGDRAMMEELLAAGRTHVNFRDYDRRTAIHVAASEGHLEICQYLVVEKGARINRSDRWGGSPLDDAHRHRHEQVIQFLRQHGATTGSGNRTTNLITAAADGDVDEVRMLLQAATAHHLDESETARAVHQKLDINKGDYDRRTALHLAAGEGHVEIVETLCKAGADVNVEDRWKRRPLDDAIAGEHAECVKILERYGATAGIRKQESSDDYLDKSSKRQADNLKIDFGELEMIDRIGSGAFGEIYKCRWRGTLVAAKIIKSAKIRRDWLNKRMMESIKMGRDVDEAVKEMDEAEMMENEKDLAIADFRQEISVLKSLRHPHIVLLLAYSTTENYECLISELMKCSLLDVFKSHLVQGTRMPKRTQLIYATQLALGMNYLHTCRPPIIHRDLKPANLLIDHSGVLKISDFGLSKVRPDPEKQEKDKFTMTGETGSYRFMAPEVFRHEDYNETVDVYSYAMILFHLLVGRPPWPNLSGMTAVKKAAEEGDRPNIPRDLDVRLQNLLKECWDDNPSVRPPFSRILKILTAYSEEVFRTSTNDIALASASEVDADCQNCVIL